MGTRATAKLVYGIDLGQEGDDDDNFDKLNGNSIPFEFYGYEDNIGCIAVAKENCVFQVQWGLIPITLPKDEPLSEEEKQGLINKLKAAGIRVDFTFSWHLASLYF
jgi:hypothetical protein